MGYINKNDEKFGLEQEQICLPLINKFFKFNLMKPEGVYNHFDFYDIDRNTYVELKSLHYFSTSFKDYEIGHWKIHKAVQHLKNGSRVYVVNNFYDKIVYYELTLKPVSLHPKEEAYGDITFKHNKMLEELIMNKPEYWLWSHKRWKHSAQSEKYEVRV